MKVNLSDVTVERPLKQELEAASVSIEANTRHIEAANVWFRVHLRPDPRGYVLKYELKAGVTLDCVRCGEPVTSRLECEDWVSLRTEQPESSHVVLNDSEMNIRFIQDHMFDLEAFRDEVIELELPDYPRHSGEAESACLADQGMYSDETLVEKANGQASPFACLSDLIND